MIPMESLPIVCDVDGCPGYVLVDFSGWLLVRMDLRGDPAIEPPFNDPRACASIQFECADGHIWKPRNNEWHREAKAQVDRIMSVVGAAFAAGN